VRTTTPNRLILALLVAGTLAGASLALPSRASAQEDTGAPLGDIARSLRKKPAPSQTVINVDDDNLSKVMDDAESRRASGGSPVFSLDPRGNDPGAKSFHVSSPDVTCSLSFTASAKTSSLSDPLLLDDLPRAELAKLEGPATIDGDSLQVSMHNGTGWDLREVVIGLTIVKRTEPDTASLGQLRIVPAVAGGFQQVQDSFQKQPDVTMLLHVKGSAAPSTTATFRTALNFALFPDQEWHWAIVRAKGIPPQTPPEMMTIMQGEAASQPPAAPDPKITPLTPSPSNKISASPDTLPH
jgi:hypothetical protein